MHLADPDNEEPRRYLVLVSEVVEKEIDAIYLGMMGATSLVFADRWRVGLIEALNSLEIFPERYVVVPESVAFRRTVRRMLYRQGRVVYRILYTLLDSDGDGIDDAVRILRVVHAARFNT